MNSFSKCLRSSKNNFLHLTIFKKPNYMDRKVITILLSFALFSSFFIPLFEWHSFEMSGLNYILSTYIPPYKYLLLLVPLSALFLFFGALDNERYFFDRKLLVRLPVLSIFIVSIIRYFTRDPEDIFSDNGKVLLGFWLTLFFSLLLVIVKNKKRAFNF
jgi:hypothetical protein